MGDHDVESSLRPHKNKRPSRTVHLYKKADFDGIREDLKQKEPFMAEVEHIGLQELWTKFRDTVVFGMKRAPQRKQDT